MPLWVREQWRGAAEFLHDRPMPLDGRRRISWLQPTAPAVILGSTGPDPFEGSRPDVVRRRSGGGAVWLDPDLCAWFDVFVPARDPLWRADIGEAFGWLGRRLAAAFTSLGVSASTCRGPYDAGPSDGLVCFASRGPGEVTVAGRKLVGISQRRTREGSRFQCVTYERFCLGPLASLLDDRAAAQVRDRATGWEELCGGLSSSDLAELVTEFITAPGS